MSIQTLDVRLLLFINNDTANALFDVLMPALTFKGYLLVIPFLAGMLVYGYRKKGAAGKNNLVHAIAAIVIACLAVYASGFVEDRLKELIGRVRPCRALDGVRLILSCPRSFSMPSGHALSSFAFAAPLYFLTREYMTRAWRLYPVVLASLIAFSRLYLGVHYPTDVLAGALLGCVIGLLLSFLYLTFSFDAARKQGCDSDDP